MWVVQYITHGFVEFAADSENDARRQSMALYPNRRICRVFYDAGWVD